MRQAAGLALMVLALAATAYAATLALSLLAVFTSAQDRQSLARPPLLFIWSIAGPFFCLGLYLCLGGWHLRFSWHLAFLALIALTIAGGALPFLQNGVNPVAALLIWALPALLTIGPVMIGLARDKAND